MGKGMGQFLREQLISCFICLDSAALFKMNEQQMHFFGKIQTSKTGQPYTDTSPYKVSEYTLA